MKNKIASFLLKVINKLFLKSSNGKKEFQDTFDYLNRISIEGKYFGYAGKVNDGGEVAVIQNLAARFNNEKLVIFDVGANIGQYQKMILEHLKSKSFQVYSFEPSEYTFSVLNSEQKPNVKNVNIGFGSKNEQLTLYRTGKGSPLSSLYQKTSIDYYKVEMKESETVNIDTIDGYCEKESIPHIHFLKMDIEGHEIAALDGAKNMIKNNKIDIIQFEFGPPNIDSKTYLRDFFLRLENYTIYRIVKNGLVEIKYSEREEVFLPVNYLAVAKKTK